MTEPLTDLYRHPLGLLTDLYQLTMAYAYWKSGTSDKEAAFNLTFRNNPFHGGFAVACGLEHLIDYVRHLHFDQSDIDYLATIPGNDEKPLFHKDFLDYLQNLRFEVDVHAVPEGTIVFAQEPLVRVVGPIIQAQILETALLNIVNFQTLVASKAARLRIAAGDRPLVEFGLRRAQGIDGSVCAVRAAYVGGCDATSNVLAGKLYGIPVKGTHAHSWVMSFDNELESFREYAQAMPNNCIFLVDTYDTLDGVHKAVEVGLQLRKEGHEMVGVRLDSGDLAYLSIEARKILDDGGFANAEILATNDLDEHIIQSLRDQGAQVSVWGVGTKLITAYDQPALGGVYKLSAVRSPGQPWKHKIKLSEQQAKISTPGILQVRRFWNKNDDDGYYLGDMILDELNPPAKDAPIVLVDPHDFTRRKAISSSAAYEDLLKPVFKAGKLVYSSPALDEIKRYSTSQLERFHPTIKRLLNPHEYPVGLEQSLHRLKTNLIMETRRLSEDELINSSAKTDKYW